MPKPAKSPRSGITKPRPARPFFVAIAGGSGSGKTWLAKALQKVLGRTSARISLDDFYYDCSHLTPTQRAALNFDDPKTIDWRALEVVLKSLAAGKPALVPRYSFKTHCRLRSRRKVYPKPIVIVDGLWPLRTPGLRKIFEFSIFLQCPSELRFRRRLARDLKERSRTRESIERQFRTMVEPMHRRHVTPQARWAKLVLHEPWGMRDVRRIAKRVLAHRAKATKYRCNLVDSSARSCCK